MVKTVSRGVSANWPTNARLTEPSGTTLGRSPLCSGHEEGGDVRHHARSGVALVGRKIHDLILRGIPMWYSHSAASSMPVHWYMGFLMKSPLIVPAVEAVDPDQAVIGGLLLELTLTVYRPAYEASWSRGM